MRWLLALIFLAAPSAAADEDAHLTAFTEGRYIEAARLVETTNSPDNLAFAARSLLAEAMSAPDYVPPPSLINQAEMLASEALTDAPEHIEARLQLAIALSLKARSMSTRAAMRSGYGERSKDLVESVLIDDPDNPYAHGFLSVWNLEVRRRGGAFGASILGASVKKARKSYQHAIELAPDDASIHWQYARALTALNAKKYRAEIDQALLLASDCTVDTTLESVMKARAETLQSALSNQHRSASERLAAKML